MPDQKFDITVTGDTLVIREGNAPNIFQYAGYNYRAYSTDSFCRLLKAKATDISAAVVFVRDDGFGAIVDTRIEDRPQDSIHQDFRFSTQTVEWMDILISGKVFTIKQMIDFLKRREPDEIENIEALLAAVKNFKYVVTTEGDFTRDDNHNYVATIRVGTAEGTVKIPDHIYANLEIYEDSQMPQEIEIEVEIHFPKNEKDGQPGFRLSCPKFTRYLEKAKLNEYGVLRRELNGFLIVKGQS